MATRKRDKQTPTTAPPAGEVAVLSRDDITAAFVNPLQLTPGDKILTLKLQGDYDKYREILRDDQVAACFQQRRRAVTSLNLEVTPASEDAADVEVADFIRETLEAVEFDRISEKMLYGLFYGYAVGECMWAVREGRVVLADVIVRKQSRFAFDLQKQLRLRNGTHDPILMPDRKFWVFRAGGDHDDDPYGLGLAHELYWPVFFKRNAVKFWLIYAEKFGMPTALAKVPAGKAEDRQFMANVLEVLRALQVDSGIAIPQDLDVSLLEAVRASAGEYDKLYDRMDKAIAKIVLSQTMTTDDGSSRSQAQVHSGVRDEVVEADVTLLYDSFNASVVRWLVDWNFGEEVRAPRVSRRTEDEPDLLPLAQRDKQISDMGFKFDRQYIEDTYGVRVEEKAEPEPGLAALPPGARPRPALAAPSFAEPGVARTQNRIDQAQFVEVAAQMANELQGELERRVLGLVQMLEKTGDLVLFRERLTDAFADDPSEAVVEAFTRAGFTARMLGRLRAE